MQFAVSQLSIVPCQPSNRRYSPSSSTFNNYVQQDLPAGDITPASVQLLYIFKIFIETGTAELSCADMASIKGEMAPIPDNPPIAQQHRVAVKQLVAYVMDKQHRTLARWNVRCLRARQPWSI